MGKDCSCCVAYGEHERALLLCYMSHEQCEIDSGYKTVRDIHKVSED